MDPDGSGGGEGASAPPPPPGERRRYKGVRLRKWGRWVSEIRMPNSRERIWLGSYESAEKAARAFDAAAVCLRGSRGAGELNFPESPPDVRCFPGALLTPEQIQAEAARHANRPCLAAAAAATGTGAAGGSSSQQAETTRNVTAVSVPSTGGGGAAAYSGDDVMDWSFMDALPAAAGSNAELVPAMDDFMYGFLQPAVIPAGEDRAEDVVDGDGDQTFFSDDLWMF